jgi:predicted MFS family arabinose efflux permease
VNSTSEVSIERMPDQVTWALLLIGVQFFLGVLDKALQMDWLYSQQAQVKTAFFAVVSALFLYGLYRRQNWLRWILVAYTALQVIAIPMALPGIHDAAQLMLTCARVILGVAASVLLCLPKSRQWYGSSSVP